jgi:uncharacterized protein
MTLRDYVDIELAGQTLRLLPEKVAVWQEKNMLLVADLHLGKAATFQASGLAMPGGHNERDLARLVEVCGKAGPTSLTILGDLFHARVGLGETLLNTLAATFETLNVPVLWIAGNHDRGLQGLAERLGVSLEYHLSLDGIELTHKPKPANAPRICGHLHPRVQFWEQKQKLTLPCFVKEREVLILPAFSSFSAGTTMKGLPHRRRYACVEDKVLELR